MTFNRPVPSRLPRRLPAVRLVAVVAAGLLLAACGRKGAPEFDSGEPVVQGDTSKNELIPGLKMPQKQATPQPQKKPRGDFILDPLL